MALQKTIMSRAGFEMSYWKITNWRPKIGQKAFDITLTPYISNQTRQDGLEAITTEQEIIKISDAPNLGITNYTDYFSPEALERSALEGKDVYKIMYNYIKLKVSKFKDATDI